MTPDWQMAVAYVNELCGSFRKLRLIDANSISFYLSEAEFKAGIQAATSRYLNSGSNNLGHGVSGMIEYVTVVDVKQLIKFVFVWGRSDLDDEPFETYYVQLEDQNVG